MYHRYPGRLWQALTISGLSKEVGRLVAAKKSYHALASQFGLQECHTLVFYEL